MPARPEPDAGLPTRHIKDVAPRDDHTKWLIRSLWISGVGLVGGQPKQLKTYVATELAYAVATGQKALGRFEVDRQGPVLGFFAEDELSEMRTRFEDVATARRGSLDRVPVHLIDVPVLYLDQAEHLRALRASVSAIKPRLLILDPFVRLVRNSDENSAAEVSAVLGTLREIQSSPAVRCRGTTTKPRASTSFGARTALCRRRRPNVHSRAFTNSSDKDAPSTSTSMLSSGASRPKKGEESHETHRHEKTHQGGAADRHRDHHTFG